MENKKIKSFVLWFMSGLIISSIFILFLLSNTDTWMPTDEELTFLNDDEKANIWVNVNKPEDFLENVSSRVLIKKWKGSSNSKTRYKKFIKSKWFEKSVTTRTNIKKIEWTQEVLNIQKPIPKTSSQTQTEQIDNPTVDTPTTTETIESNQILAIPNRTENTYVTPAASVPDETEDSYEEDPSENVPSETEDSYEEDPLDNSPDNWGFY